MYKHTYETRYGDYKDIETISTGCLLDLVQDASTRHSKEMGYDIFKLKEMNIAWLIQGFNAEIISPANTVSPIDVHTAIRTLKGATSERGCILMQDGKIIAKTIANWFTFDTEKESVCKIPSEICQTYKKHDFEDEFFKYTKFKLQEDAKPIYSICIRKKEIDTNGHLNNQKSAVLLMDALPCNFEVRKMSVMYKKPAYLGDELTVCTKDTPDGTYVHLMDKNGEVCVAGLFESF